ncbi:hypothetical protein QCA50_001144 [Cerrena zonata]|uniref:Uncharacterized protein n=1 Tax=Cerrena zonata TaxID=2478898 RepID=A0AAW0GUN3_9APHY
MRILLISSRPSLSVSLSYSYQVIQGNTRDIDFFSDSQTQTIPTISFRLFSHPSHPPILAFPISSQIQIRIIDTPLPQTNLATSFSFPILTTPSSKSSSSKFHLLLVVVISVRSRFSPNSNLVYKTVFLRI